MSIAKAFFLGIIVAVIAAWLIPAVLTIVFSGLALVGAVAIARKLVSAYLLDPGSSKDGEP